MTSQVCPESFPGSCLEIIVGKWSKTEWAKVRKASCSLLPTLTGLEAQLSGHQQGQHEQYPLHGVGCWNALLREGLLLPYKPLAPCAQPSPLSGHPDACRQGPSTQGSPRVSEYGKPLPLHGAHRWRCLSWCHLLLERSGSTFAKRSSGPDLSHWLHSVPNARFPSPSCHLYFLATSFSPISWLQYVELSQNVEIKTTGVKDRSVSL